MKAFVYPMKSLDSLEMENPYLSRFVKAVDRNFPVVNLGKKSVGMLSAIKHVSKADVFFLNWVEGLSWYHLPFFYLFLLLSKVLKRRIIWIHHNIEPHGGKTFSSRAIIHALERFSSKIIIHTKQSYNYLNPSCHGRCIYLLHPYFSTSLAVGAKERFDILIWGTVRKSKGILEFVTYLKDHDAKLKVLIVGRFQDDVYYNNVLEMCSTSSNIVIENRFIKDEEFLDLHAVAKKIVFIYNGPSVLNSGALIKSLSTGRDIIGPHRGAFVDYEELGLIKTFTNFDDIISLAKQSSDNKKRMATLESSIEENTWDKFGDILNEKIA
ncbi:hypothetical protein [Sphingobacterium griseoflavum]|uniref:Glycosyl transferase n=1 Tax=Sphingobacterium griseoflavum TaxID=1474952 RepID=A0ABQ3HVK8_9SPHI|nr:hypothetical protein [Sphingobacterium griseoflavum]GHE39074.1 glycosyl transferase [Sphingobacterium griseoflavum]